MSDNVTRIHHRATPNRPHYIVEWAEKRGMRQADLAEALSADKSVVSRWFNGSTPAEHWQAKLALLFNCEPEALFRHPDDDWITKFFKGRSADEIERIKATLEAAFPKAG